MRAARVLRMPQRTNLKPPMDPAQRLAWIAAGAFWLGLVLGGVTVALVERL
jgi:hypothetical protein